jgi:hypothetical protein
VGFFSHFDSETLAKVTFQAKRNIKKGELFFPYFIYKNIMLLVMKINKHGIAIFPYFLYDINKHF